MIRYPKDVKAEMLAAAEDFCKNASEAIIAADENTRQDAMRDYVYEHCSDRTKAFLDDVRAIQSSAEKQGLMV